jgi:N-acetylglucosaminyldiphosphoundecaprenol N-acetyl-beta-D-mannosaminyltransferase
MTMSNPLSNPDTIAPRHEIRGHPTDWINLLGVRISAVNMTTAVARVQEAIASGRKGYICIRDVHGIIRCQNDAELRRIHNRAFLVTPDGMPVAWALRLAGHRQADRVYGPDLMLALFDQGRRTGVRHFLYGATPEILAQLQAALVARFPGADVAGHHSPPFRDLTADEERDVAARINASGADIVWVGLGTPKQELWMGRMRDRLAASMLIGVGAAFDFHAGVKRQAPRFVQRSGFEWLFRLACEPRRLAWRYAVAVPNFIGLATAQALRLRHFPLQDDVPERASS